jgi:rhodanese-related sulfurtransferase
MRLISYAMAVLAVALVVAYFFYWLPEQKKVQELPIDQLLLELQNEKRFISTDQLAERMIGQDPGLLLIDVREAAAFDEYTLPGAMNIPLGEMLDPAYDHYFKEADFDIVFFGNSNFLAEQAWMIKRRQNYSRLFILNGGVNQWENDILSPQAPPETASSEAFERYAFRQAALQFFNGESKAFDPSTAAGSTSEEPKKTIQFIPKANQQQLEGC